MMVDNPAVSLSERVERRFTVRSRSCFSFAATKRMQADELTAGNFLWEWKNLIFMHRQGVVGAISKAIITCGKGRGAAT